MNRYIINRLFQMIPVIFGVLLALAGAVSLKNLKHGGHIAALIGVLGFLGTARSFAKVPALLSGEPVERAAAVGVQAVFAVLCLVFIGLTVKSFFHAMAEHGLEKEHYIGAWTPGTPLPWDVVQSGVSENYFHYELRLAAQDQTGLSCPPDSAGCLACQACDPNWAFRYGDNANRPVPAAKGGPWRAEDWLPWTQLKASAIDVQAK